MSPEATGRAWRGTTVWRWRCTTGPPTPGGWRAFCLDSGITAGAAPFSLTPHYGQNPFQTRLSHTYMGHTQSMAHTHIHTCVRMCEYSMHTHALTQAYTHCSQDTLVWTLDVCTVPAGSLGDMGWEWWVTS